jgi:hypothetical protein
MASLTAAQRTTLESAKDTLITALSTYVDGEPFVVTYTVAGRTKTVHDPNVAFGIIDNIDRLLDADNSHSRTWKLYGRHMRYPRT